MSAVIVPGADVAAWLRSRLAAVTRRGVSHPPGVRGLPAYCGCCGCIKRYCICRCCCGK